MMAFAILKTTQKVSSPLFNNVNAGLSLDDRQRFIAARMMEALKDSPELLGILDTLVNDHFMGDIDYFGVDGVSTLGPTQQRKAENFWNEMKVQDAFYGQGIDYFSDGHGFGWQSNGMDGITPDQQQAIARIKETLTKVKNFGFMGSFIDPEVVDSEIERPKKIWYLSASTTEVLHDASGIIGYKQDANGKPVIWRNDQVIPIKLMEYNGEVRGMSGLKGLIREIAIMFMLKENIIAQIENGGSADNIISIEGGNGFSKGRFNRLRTALESFSHIRKSHGNMPIDAVVKVHPLGTGLKDMEYRELAMFAISEFALATGLPISRMPMIMTGQGGSTTKGQMSGTTEDAYQKKINNRRRKWETAWNPTFKKAGFTFRFRRDNLQDEVRETQASTQRAAYIISIQEGLAKIDKQLKLDAHLAILSGKKMNISSEDVEKLVIQDNPMIPGGDGINKNDLKNSNVDLASRVTNDISNAKKQTATNGGVST